MKPITFFVFLFFNILSINIFAQETPMTQEQYDNSLAVFEAGKKEHDNCYEFAFSTTSFSGHWSKTFLVVEDGKVIERRYVTGSYYDKKKKETVHWVERGSALGYHSEGKAIMTMDEFYKMGKGAVGQKTREEVIMPPIDKKGDTTKFTILHFYNFDPQGLLSMVGHQHQDCMDDCFQGLRMTNFKWGKTKTSSLIPSLYSPLKKDAKFQAYSLDKELVKNEMNKKDGKATSYACNIINEFLLAFYPNAVFEWQSTDNTFFSFKGYREHNKERHELYLSWQSYSDGLEWNFWTTDLFRVTNDMDPFDIITNYVAATKIKNYLAAHYAKKDTTTLDIFRQATRSFTTPQKTENIPFKANEVITHQTYGVYINNKLLVFDLNGNFLHQE